MTKAELLKALDTVPMNAPVVFFDGVRDEEYGVDHVYRGDGYNGLCLILTDAPITYTDEGYYSELERVL